MRLVLLIDLRGSVSHPHQRIHEHEQMAADILTDLMS